MSYATIGFRKIGYALAKACARNGVEVYPLQPPRESIPARVNPGSGEGISSIPLAVELHGRWHVMTPSIELRDGVCLEW